MIDFNELKKNKIKELKLPSWLEIDCRSCNQHMDCNDILGLGVELTPKKFGNLSVSYLCPQCSSLVEVHYVKAMFDSLDISSILAMEEPPSKPVPFIDVDNSKEHNLL